MMTKPSHSKCVKPASTHARESCACLQLQRQLLSSHVRFFRGQEQKRKETPSHAVCRIRHTHSTALDANALCTYYYLSISFGLSTYPVSLMDASIAALDGAVENKNR